MSEALAGRKGLWIVLAVAVLVLVVVALDVRDAPFWTAPVVDEIAYM